MTQRGPSIAKTGGGFRFLSVTALFLAMLLTGCGGKSKNVGLPGTGGNSGLGINGASNCKSKTDCPMADPGYGANMAPAGVFVGWVDKPVDWRVFGIDEKTKNPDGISSARRMVVLLDKVPEGSTITPFSGEKLSNEAGLQWTPTSEESGKLDIIVRDYERCVMDKKAEGYCDAYKFLEAYDKRFKGVRWEVKDQEKLEEDLANGTVTETATGTTTDCTTSTPDLQTSLMNTFIQALANPSGLGGVATTIFSSSGVGGSATGC